MSLLIHQWPVSYTQHITWPEGSHFVWPWYRNNYIVADICWTELLSCWYKHTVMQPILTPFDSSYDCICSLGCICDLTLVAPNGWSIPFFAFSYTNGHGRNHCMYWTIMGSTCLKVADNAIQASMRASSSCSVWISEPYSTGIPKSDSP